MNNKVSIEITSAKLNSKKYHAKVNAKLYKEYIESGQQYVRTFAEWKEYKFGKRKKKKQPEPMQKKLTAAERKAREKEHERKGAKSLNTLYRHK